MTRFNWLNLPFFNVPDAGAGGAPAAPATSAAATPPADGGSPPAPSAGAPAPAASDPAGAGAFYRPEGLPDHLVGKDQAETMDKLYGALKGYRERDAANVVPEKAEAYAEFAGDIPETIKPHLDTLKGDPLFGRLNEKALALKVPAPVYQGLVQEFLSVSAEMGLMEPIVDAQAERAALVPQAAAHLSPAEQGQAVEKRMNENFAFLDALAAAGADKGGLSKDDADFAKAMLGDSAKGHRVFEWMRAASGAAGDGGKGPSMQAAPGGASDPRDDLRRRAALPENTVGHPQFNRASYDALNADYQRVIGK
ncbi:MAG: hypothetical protein DI589_06605 [Shinella sp.]|nr:MAG: hypothetical protein DI589_06605 [Shinella sp.]